MPMSRMQCQSPLIISVAHSTLWKSMTSYGYQGKLLCADFTCRFTQINLNKLNDYPFAREPTLPERTMYCHGWSSYSTGTLKLILQLWQQQVRLSFNTTLEKLPLALKMMLSRTCSKSNWFTDIWKPLSKQGPPSITLFFTTSPVRQWRAQMHLVVLSLTPDISQIFLYLYPCTVASRNTSRFMSDDICCLMVMVVYSAIALHGWVLL